jgi:hypothetical protein
MRRLLPLAVLVLPLVLTFCDDSDNDLVPIANGSVEMRDDCDPASFNAALGDGTCTKAGGTTFGEFNAELNANHTVAAWAFVPSELTITVGGVVNAVNMGGE